VRRRGERGVALLWAVAAVTLVLLGVSAVAASLSRQAGAVRRLHAQETRMDLIRAGRARVASFGTRPVEGETIELVGGRVEIRPRPDGSVDLVVHVRGEAPDAALRIAR
jgi:hypothetical protein